MFIIKEKNVFSPFEINSYSLVTALPPVRSLEMIRNSNGSSTIKWKRPYGFIGENVCFYIVEIDGRRNTTENTEYIVLPETLDKDIIVSDHLIRVKGLKD